MSHTSQRLPFFAALLNVVAPYYFQCSDSTRQNFGRLGRALSFSVLVCGAVLAASFCEFWLARNYGYMPLVFIATGLFYFLLDQAIIMGDQRRGGTSMRHLRLVIALVLGLFNSFLIDYYFFRDDIAAARVAEIRHRQEAIAEDYNYQVNLKEGRRAELLVSIDAKEAELSAQLDSLNSEASGLGGSGRRGIAVVWTAKYNSYRADSLRAAPLVESKRVEAAGLARDIRELKAQSEEEQAAVAATVSQGINQSLELLHRIIWLEGKFTNIFMSVLILLVSMLLELVPLLAKEFYDVEEYFEVAARHREALMANAALRQQNAIHREAAVLMNENARELAGQRSATRLQEMEAGLEHCKKVMAATEVFMDELGDTEARWQERYPALYEQYGKPVIDKSYGALSVATERVYI